MDLSPFKKDLEICEECECCSIRHASMLWIAKQPGCLVISHVCHICIDEDDWVMRKEDAYLKKHCCLACNKV